MAHGVRDPDRDRKGFLLPARLVRPEFKRARVYPRALMLEPVVFDGVTLRPKRRRDGRGVVRKRIAEDSMHDALYETQRRLEDECGGVAGLSARHCTVSVADARNAALQGRSGGVGQGGFARGGREVVDRNRAVFHVESAAEVLRQYRAGTWRAEE